MNDWAVVLFDHFVHPVQVAIMEAFDWIEEPFSPSQFFEMKGDVSLTLSNASYHFRALEQYGVLAVAELRPVRGAIEVIYQPAEIA